MQKVIGITTGAQWEADGIGMFQYNLQQYFMENTSLVVRFLDNRNTEEARDFWYFLLDGPHPELGYQSVITKPVADSIRNTSEAMYALLQEVYAGMPKHTH